jgi:hypothetical protein
MSVHLCPLFKFDASDRFPKISYSDIPLAACALENLFIDTNNMSEDFKKSVYKVLTLDKYFVQYYTSFALKIAVYKLPSVRNMTVLNKLSDWKQ